ncbi:type II toxin-antitoxin system VapC family toxin [Streptomyces sp. AC495_CC817]|uniref:type II toxin-antitoxin system VapC family toxin n=1 Tax=Streptomyces sp. AC495_CC817 TaxID=2823900 RepID=UPI001C2691B6|nr:type II toxin-antitoxin system VapC family toxin [Streptomyces sp. AC495_CC817]
MIYLDTSAAAKLLIDEAESDAVADLFAQGAEFVSSRLLAVELAAIVDRRLIAPQDVQQVIDRVALVSLDDDIADAAVTLRSGLRTLDALHLATALRLGAAVDGILTFDLELRARAHSHGLTAVL